MKLSLVFAILIFVFTSCSPPIPSHCDRINSALAPNHPPILTDVEFASKYGGPYKYKAGFQKVSNFAVYNTYGLFHSSAMPITTDLFFQSIVWYCEHEADYPYGEAFQRYNYVVNNQDQIWVAVWNMDISFQDLYKEGHCANLKLEGFRGSPGKGIMINFYPEDTDLTNDFPNNNIVDAYNFKEILSPCRIITPPHSNDANDYPGFLDGMSKHFFISQFSSTPNYRGIENYNPVEWTKTEVEYAGEIVVDVINCQYIVNNWSGTYKPDPPGDFLPEIGLLFAEILGVRPAMLRTFDGLEIPIGENPALVDYRDDFCD